jgi:hypothetical protein
MYLYSPYLETISSMFNLKTRHAICQDKDQFMKNIDDMKIGVFLKFNFLDTELQETVLFPSDKNYPNE